MQSPTESEAMAGTENDNNGESLERQQNNGASEQAGQNLFNAAYDCGGSTGGSRGGSHHRHHENTPYPLPEKEPFVIIGANPGEVRTGTESPSTQLTPHTSTNAQGEVRPGTRVQ
jgi:hypothetical protein